MLQTGLIPNAHNDLVTDAAYDFYGLHLATCSLDQRFTLLSSIRDRRETERVLFRDFTE